MVHRDPETGRFVSDSGGGHGDASYGRTRTITGAMHSEIAAADLAGGTTTDTVEAGAALELIDFDEVLVQENEVYEVVMARLLYYVNAHTTATAEGWVGVGWEVTTDQNLGTGELRPPFTGSGSGIAGSNATISQDSRRAEQTFDHGFLNAEPSHSDTTNGLAAGADYNIVDRQIEYRQAFDRGPMFDMDDSWFVPHRYHIDNIDDHAVQFGVACQLEGVVHDV